MSAVLVLMMGNGLGGIVQANELEDSKKPKVFPYQDYLIVVVHGLNDSKLTPIGQNPEYKDRPEIQARWAIEKKLEKILEIPDGYIQSYSYSQSRGSNLQNAMELGLSGYRPASQSDRKVDWGVLKNVPPQNRTQLSGEKWLTPLGITGTIGGIGLMKMLNGGKDVEGGGYGETELVLGGLLASMVINAGIPALEQDTIMGTGFATELQGNPYPKIGTVKNPFTGENRTEYFPYYPGTHEYYAGGIEPGHSFLEQAVLDFKEWLPGSDYGKSLGITTKNDPRIDAMTPKKYILITHSMGNISARLYIYSNELAAKGKYFKEGFYKGNVQKVVFVAPPLEGSDAAELGGLSPVVETGLELLGKYDFAKQIGSDVLGGRNVIQGLFDRQLGNKVARMIQQLQDPFLVIKNPIYPITMGQEILTGFGNDWIYKPKKANEMTLARQLKLAGKPPAWAPAIAELEPKSEIINELKQVSKPHSEQEPSYAIVYGSGMPGVHVGRSLGMLPVKGIGLLGTTDLLSASQYLTGIPEVITYFSPEYQALSPRNRLVSWFQYYNTGQTLFEFTQTGDAAVPVWSARGENIPYLKNARRIEKSFEPDFLGSLDTNLTTAITAAELFWFIPGGAGAVPWIRLGVVMYAANEIQKQKDNIDTYLLAHTHMFGAEKEIIEGLMDVPEISMSDSNFVAQTVGAGSGIGSGNVQAQTTTKPAGWSGVFVPTSNRQIAGFSIQTQGARAPSGNITSNYYIAAPDLETIKGNGVSAIELNLNGNPEKVTAIALPDESVVIRGLIRDLAPKKMKEVSYSLNFSGWTDFRSKVQNDGRFELGPIDLAEGQNLIAFKLINYAGYSSNQVLKMLKTGISVQPVLDALVPQPDSVTQNPTLNIHVVYQNKKYSDSIANGIQLNQISVAKRLASATQPTEFAYQQSVPILQASVVGTASINIPGYSEKQVRDRNGVNRLEVDFPLTVTADGTYDVVAEAKDDYGTSSFLRYSFEIDRLAPNVDIEDIPPQNLTLRDGQVTPSIHINWAVSDNAHLSIKHARLEIRNAAHQVQYTQEWQAPNGGPYQSIWQPGIGEHLKDGQYSVNVSVTDWAGNVTETQKTVWIDRIAPTLIEQKLSASVFSSASASPHLQIRASEPVTGILSVKVPSLNYSQAIPFPQASAVQEQAVATSAIDIPIPVSEVPLVQGPVDYLIRLTDIAGNSSEVTGQYMIDQQGPEFRYLTLDPLVISSKTQSETTVAFALTDLGSIALGQDSVAVTLSVWDGSGNQVWLKRSDARLEHAQLRTVPVSQLKKGSYRLKIEASDTFGNPTQSGLDFMIDGSEPVISYPDFDGIPLLGVTAIRGTVIDPDFTNTRPMQRFEFRFKKGAMTQVSAADFASFEQNPLVLSVPARLRRLNTDGLNLTMGNTQVRSEDTLAILNPATLSRDSEYTIAVAAVEEGIGITAISSRVVYVPPSIGNSVSDRSFGQLVLGKIPKSVAFSENGAALSIPFSVTGGNASVGLEIINQKSQKVVFDRQYRDIKSPTYSGLPDVRTDAPAIYWGQLTPTAPYTVIFKSDAKSQTFDLTLVAEGGTIQSIVPNGFGLTEPPVLGPIGRISVTVPPNSERKLTIDSDATQLSLIAQQNNDPMSSMALTQSIRLGAKQMLGGSLPVVISRQAIPEFDVAWDGKLANGAGWVDSGIYELKFTTEGPNGLGVKITAVTVNVVTTATITIDGLSPTTIEFDPFVRSETAVLSYRVNKSSRAFATLIDGTGKTVKTLIDNEITHPTDPQNPYRVSWDGSIDGVIVKPGDTYFIRLDIRPNDGSVGRTITQAFRAKSTDFSMGNSAAVLKPIGEKWRYRGQESVLAKGQPLMSWTASAQGLFFPTLDLNYDVTLDGGIQTIDSYPYVPFVAVAHRWFDQLNVVVDIEVKVKYKGSNYRFLNGWQRDDREINNVYRYPFQFSISDPTPNVRENQYVYVLSDTTDLFWAGKPGLEFQDVQVKFKVKTPDGSLIEEKIVTASDVERYVSGEKGAFSYKAVVNRRDIEARYRTDKSKNSNGQTITVNVRVNDGQSNRYVVDVAVKMEEDIKYSRLTNRFYPWYGVVNRNRSREFDFGTLFSNPDQLGFPHTQFFELPLDVYRAAWKQLSVHESKSNLNPDEKLTELVTAPTSNTVVKNLGSSYTNYLSGEHFDVQWINLDKPYERNRWYTVQKIGKSGFKVSSDFVVPISVKMADPATLESIRAQNAAGRQLFDDLYSQGARNLNAQLKTKPESLDLSRQVNSDNTFAFDPKRIWLEINENQWIDSVPTLHFSHKIDHQTAQSRYEWQPAILPSFLAQLTEKWVPAHGQFRIVAPSVSGGSNTVKERLKIRFSNGSDVMAAGSTPLTLVAEVAESDWGEPWTGFSDPNLKQGQLVSALLPVEIPLFSGRSQSIHIPFKTGYPVMPIQSPTGLFSATQNALMENPSVQVQKWTSVSLWDIRGSPHPDLEVVRSQDRINGQYTNDGFSYRLRSGQSPSEILPIRSVIQVIPGQYRLSVLRNGVWEPIEMPSSISRDRHPDVIGYWNTSRLNGKYTIKFEDLIQKSIALTDVMVGTLVPQNATEPVVVNSPYERVKLSFFPGSFDADTLVTVTPVKLSEIHIQNMPDISDLDFMPIVEIFPEGANFSGRTKPQLIYQYSADEVKSIQSGTYPGISKPIRLDDVQIYHISQSGNLALAQTIPGGEQRWQDLDQDGVLGSSGDVYRITAQLDHFSVYGPIEGYVPFQPSLSAVSTRAATDNIDLVGTIQQYGPNQLPLGLQLFIDDDAQLNQNDDTTPPQQVSLSDRQLEWLNGTPNVRIKSVPLGEGVNYLTLTYPTKNTLIKTPPFASVSVIRDTVPPSFSITLADGQEWDPNRSEPLFLSPNQDGKSDSVVLLTRVSEPGRWIHTVLNASGNILLQYDRDLNKNDHLDAVQLSWNGGVDWRLLPSEIVAQNRLPDGAYTWVMAVADEAANRSVEQRIKVILDTQSPVLVSANIPTIISMRPNSDLPVVTARVSDNVAVKSAQLVLFKHRKVVSELDLPIVNQNVEINLDQWFRKAIEPIDEGRFEWEMVLSDAASNTSRVTGSITIDNQPPTIVQAQFSATTLNAKQMDVDAHFLVTVTDNRVATLDLAVVATLARSKTIRLGQWVVTGNQSQSIPVSLERLKGVDGELTISLLASDGLYISEKSVPLLIDQTPPSVATFSILSPTFNPNSDRRMVLQATLSEPIHTGVLSVSRALSNGGIETVATAPIGEGLSLNWHWPKTLLPKDGPLMVQLILLDEMGNEGVSPTMPVMVDSTPPTLSVSSYKPWVSEQDPIVISGRFLDAQSDMLSVNWDWLMGTKSQRQSLSVSTNVATPFSVSANETLGSIVGYRCEVIDQALNKTTVTGSVSIDRLAPIINWNMPKDMLLTSSNRVSVMMQVSDPDSGQIRRIESVLSAVSAPEVSVTGAIQVTQAPTIQIDWPHLVPGDYVGTVLAQDEFNHITTRNFQVVIDQVPPGITVNMANTIFDLANEEPLIFSVSATDNRSDLFKIRSEITPINYRHDTLFSDQLQYRIELSKYMLGSSQAVITLPLQIALSDLAGNTVTQSRIITVINHWPTPEIVVSNNRISASQPLHLIVKQQALAPLVADNAKLNITLVQRSNPSNQIQISQIVVTASPVELTWVPDSGVLDGDDYGIVTELVFPTKNKPIPQWHSPVISIRSHPVDLSQLKLMQPVLAGHSPIELDFSKVDKAAIATWSISVRSIESLSEGRHQIGVSAQSLWGLWSQVTLNLTVDRTPPQITVPTEPILFSVFKNTRLSIPISVSEPNCEIQYRVYDAQHQPVNGLIMNSDWITEQSLVWEGKTGPDSWVPSGRYTLEVFAQDAAGNVGTSNITISHSRDLPDIWIQSGFEAMNPSKGSKSIRVILAQDFDAITLKMIPNENPDMAQVIWKEEFRKAGTHTVIFSGRSADGKWLEDGNYRFEAVGRPSLSPDQTITQQRPFLIKTRIPPIYPRLSTTRLLKNDAEIEIQNMPLITSEALHIGIESVSGHPIKTWFEKPLYAIGVQVPPLTELPQHYETGKYVIRVRLSDDAENSVESVLPFEYVTKITGFLQMNLDTDYLTPNSDGLFDQIDASLIMTGTEPEYPIKSRIVDSNGVLVRNLPDRFVRNNQRARHYWDGLDEQGKKVVDGRYDWMSTWQDHDTPIGDSVKRSIYVVGQGPQVSLDTRYWAISSHSTRNQDSVNIIAKINLSPAIQTDSRFNGIVEMQARLEGPSSLNIPAQRVNTRQSNDWVQKIDMQVLGALISFPGLYRINITATDELGNRTITDIGTLSIDSDSPAAPEITAVSRTYTNQNSVSMTVSSEPDAWLQLIRNGTLITEIGAGVSGTVNLPTVNVLAGENRFEVVAIDAAGNRSITSNAVTVIQDTTPPEIISVSRSAPKSGLHIDQWLQVTYSEDMDQARVPFIDAPVSVNVVWKSARILEIRYSVAQTGLQETQHLSVGAAQDLAGNSSLVASSLESLADGLHLIDVEVDTIAPAVSSIKVTYSRWTTPNFEVKDGPDSAPDLSTGNATVSVEFTEPMDIGKLTLSVMGADIPAQLVSTTDRSAIYQISIDESQFPSGVLPNREIGRFTFENTTDLAGNSITPNNNGVWIDLAPPSVVSHGSDNGIVDRLNPLYGVIKPYDVSGEWDKIALVVTFSEPVIRPSIAIVDLESGAIIREIAHYTLADSDSVLRFDWDGRDNSGRLVGENQKNARYGVRIRAQDHAQNRLFERLEGVIRVQHMTLGAYLDSLPLTPVHTSANIQFRFKISNRIPEPLPDGFRTFSVSKQWGYYTIRVIDETGQTVTSVVNQPIFQTDTAIQWVWPVQDVPEGKYRFELTAMDNAGNPATQNIESEQYQMVVDHTAPHIQQFSVPEFVAQPSISVDIQASDNVDAQNELTYFYRVNDGVEQVLTNGKIQIADIPGQYPIMLKAVDRAGNQSVVVTQSATLDLTDPKIELSWVQAIPSVLAGVDVEASQNLAVSVSVIDDHFDSIQLQLGLDNDPIRYSSASGTYSLNGLKKEGLESVVMPLIIRAIDRSGRESTLTRSVLVDQLAPTFTVLNLPAAINTPQINVQLRSIHETNWPISVAQWQEGWHELIRLDQPVDEASLTLPALPEGLHTVKLRMTDRLGNISEVQEQHIETDYTNPEIIGPNTDWQRTINDIIPIVSDSKSGISRSQFAWDSGSWIDFEPGSPISPIPGEGTHTLQIQVIDRADNRTEWQGVIKQDTRPPQIDILSDLTGWQSTTIGDVRFRVLDEVPGSGISSATYRWDHSPEIPVDFNHSMTTVPGDGQHTLVIRAQDSAGNSTEIQRAFLQDTIVPQVLADKADGLWTTKDIGLITLGVYDSGSEIQWARYRWDNPDLTQATAYTTGTQIQVPNDGHHTLYLGASDLAGNTVYWQGIYRQDRQVPTITFSNTNSEWQENEPQVTVHFSDSGGSGILLSRYRWDSSADGGDSFSNGETLRMPHAGVATLNILISDVAGNQFNTSATYRWDQQNPQISASGSNPAWVNQFLPIVVAASDGESGIKEIRYRWNHSDVESGGLTYSGSVLTPPSSGSNILYLKAWDVSGRSTTWQGQYRQDAQAPSIEIPHSSSQWRNQNVGPISVQVSDLGGAGIQTQKYRWDNPDVDNGSTLLPTQQLSIPGPGDHRLYVLAVDAAGNRSVSSGTYRLDTAPPVLSVTTPSGGWVNQPVLITISGSDTLSGVAEIKYRWNNADMQGATAMSSGATITLNTPGQNTLYVQVRDNAGNSVLQSYVYRFDNQVPVCSADGSSSNWINANKSIRLSASDSGGAGVAIAKYRWDHSDVANGTLFSDSQSITIPSDGDHVLYVRAWDSAGNESGVWSGSYRLDRQAPVISATGASSTQWHQQIPTITIIGEEVGASGLSWVEYRWEDGSGFVGKAVSGYAFNNSVSSVPYSDGIHTLSITLKDQAGNGSTWSGQYQVDHSGPRSNGEAVWSQSPFRPMSGPLRAVIPVIDDGSKGIRCIALEVVRDGLSVPIGEPNHPQNFASTIVLNPPQGVIASVLEFEWDGRNAAGVYMAERSDYYFRYKLIDSLGNESGWISTKRFDLRYYEVVSDYAYSIGYFKLGTDSQTWAIAPGRNSIQIRRSIPNNKWTFAYLFDLQKDLIDVCSSVDGDRIAIYAKDPVSFEKYRIVLPQAYEVFVSNTDSGYAMVSGQAWSVYKYNSDSSGSDKFSSSFYEAEHIPKTWSKFRKMMPSKGFAFSFDSDDFKSVIVTGYFIAPDSGTYWFSGNVDDGCRLWIDGTHVFQGMENDSNKVVQKSIYLTKNQIYPYILWLNNFGDPGNINLRYSIGSSEKRIIPTANFFADPIDPPSQKEMIWHLLFRSYARGVRQVLYNTTADARIGYLRGTFILDSFQEVPINTAGNVFMPDSDSIWFSIIHNFLFLPGQTGLFNWEVDSDDTHYIKIDGVPLLNKTETWRKSYSSYLNTPGFHLINHWFENFSGPYRNRFWYNTTLAGDQSFSGNKVYIRLDGDINIGHSVYAPAAVTGSVSTTDHTIQWNPPEILSPSQNQVVLTNKPTFTWQIDPNTHPDSQFQIELVSDAFPFSDLSPITNPSIRIPILPAQLVRSENRLSYTPDWKDTLSKGFWKWQVVQSIENESKTSDPAVFEVDPPLTIEGGINYPNPFKHQTRIRYKLSRDAMSVKIRIYTIRGQLVRELDGDTSAASSAQEYHDVIWDGNNGWGEPVLNGIYIYKIDAQTGSESKQMTGKMMRVR